MSLVIYTDGCCDPNPGPGGWGFVAYRGNREVHRDCGGDSRTSINQMELTAVLQAVEWIGTKVFGEITIFSNSNYVVRGCNSWRKGWKARDWYAKRRGQKKVKNLHLWKPLDAALCRRKINIRWAKGPDGAAGVELASKLADQGQGPYSRTGPNPQTSNGRSVFGKQEKKPEPTNRSGQTQHQSSGYEWPDALYPLRDLLELRGVQVHSLKSERQALYFAHKIGLKRFVEFPSDRSVSLLPMLMSAQTELCGSPAKKPGQEHRRYREHQLGTFGAASPVRHVDPAEYKAGRAC